MIPFLHDVVFKDFWLKLFSFALAILAWFTVDVALRNATSPAASLSLLPTERRVFPNLPVVVMSSAEEARGVRVNPKEVEVIVQGEGKALARLQSKDIRVLVDLTVVQAAHDLKIRIEVLTPPGIHQVKVDPEEVQVTFNSKE